MIQRDLSPTMILITHAHIDHIVYLNETRDMFRITAAVHGEDFEAVTDNLLNGSDLFGSRKVFRSAEIILNDNDVMESGSLMIKTIHTPGHTPGCVSFHTDNMVFTGDTLFYLSIGRTDLGRGNQDNLMNSIKRKLFYLPEKTIVYPGHGTFTTIEYERNENPFVI
jgi:glyoxylase-like metal-dependent hydrolase (beta-lactamase superfamily II)